MKNISDEMLNKYIDGESRRDETEFIKQRLNDSEELQKRLATLRLVDNHLRKMEIPELPGNFTLNLMSRISRKSKVKKHDKIFILSISSIFILASLIIIGFLLANFITLSSGQSDPGIMMESLLSYSEDISKSVLQLFNPKYISIFGSIISFGLIISGYFFFEQRKHSNNNI
jgi:hypothetical protein